jgi:DNA-binding beta-propeller fold protein YncE
VRSIYGEEDLKKDTTFTQSLVAFLTGEVMPVNRVAYPVGLATSDDADRLYVSDMLQQAVYIFDFKKQVFFKLVDVGIPAGIALDAEEKLYVVDTATKTILVFGPDHQRVHEFADPALSRPTGIAIDKTNRRIYVVDTGSREAPEHNVKIYDLQGKRLGALGGKPGGDFGQFLYPTYVTVDSSGNVYVSDTLNARVQKFDANGKHVYTYGQMGTSWGEFDKPKGVAIDGFGNLYVVDSGWSNVQIFNERGQILLFFGGRGPLPGMLKNPLSIAIDKNNRIYVGDYLNHRVEVYELVNTTASDSFLNPPAKNPVAKGAK